MHGALQLKQLKIIQPKIQLKETTEWEEQGIGKDKQEEYLVKEIHKHIQVRSKLPKASQKSCALRGDLKDKKRGSIVYM